VGVTTGGDVGVTSSASSVPVGVTESYLLNPAYKAEIQIDRDDSAAPTAPPPGDGLAATPAGVTAQEEASAIVPPSQAEPTFELLWRTYGKERAGGKKEARAAWKALPPETVLAAVIEAAAAWREEHQDYRSAWKAMCSTRRGRPMRSELNRCKRSQHRSDALRDQRSRLALHSDVRN
jgi:hypothetical protein